MNNYNDIYKYLCEKYKVRKNADYMEAVKTMKKNGVTKKELDELMEAWAKMMGEK